MNIKWVLYGHIPKVGMERRFREIENNYVKMIYDSSLSEKDREFLDAEHRRIFASICRTPKDFDEKFDPSNGIVDGGRVHGCQLLPAPLRARALIEQTAPEAIDYGDKMMSAVRMVRDSTPGSKSELNYVLNYNSNPNPLIIERDLNFLRNTAMWLITWGKRGFGYFVLR